MTEKRGRPAFQPTEEQRRTVRAMAGYGIPQDEIAVVLDIDPKTLRLHFWREIQAAAIEANAKVAQSLFKRATDPAEKGSSAVAAQMFWLRCRAGWREEPHASTPPPLGKKEQRELEAQHAEKGTEWDALLN